MQDMMESWVNVLLKFSTLYEVFNLILNLLTGPSHRVRAMVFVPKTVPNAPKKSHFLAAGTFLEILGHCASMATGCRDHRKDVQGCGMSSGSLYRLPRR